MHHKYMDKIQKNIRTQKSSFFTYFCSQETAPGIAGMTHQESLYGKTPGPARSPLRRAGNAALRRAADRPLALRPPHGRPAADDRHRRRAPPAARRTVLAGVERPGARHRVGRRHEEIPVPHARRALRRVGLHPRRGAGHARVSSPGRMPHGLPLLRHGAAGASAVAHGGRNPQPGGFAAERVKLTNLVFMAWANRSTTRTRCCGCSR